MTRRIMVMIMLAVLVLYPSVAGAEILDRVVAYVDNRAITYSEFREAYDESKRKGKNVSEQDMLDSMINRHLLLKEARRLRLDAETEDQLLENYIELRIRSMIIIGEKEARKFYDDNQSEFKGRTFNEMRDHIESYLFEKETNSLLKRQVDQLRGQSMIVVQL